MPRLADDRARCDAIRPAMEALLRDPSPIPDSAREPLEGQAVGNVLHTDAARPLPRDGGRVPRGDLERRAPPRLLGRDRLPAGGRRGDALPAGRGRRRPRPTRSRRAGGGEPPHLAPGRASPTCCPWTRAPPRNRCWHRVRNPGPGTGVSVHVLCRTPSDHPHRFWDRHTNAVLPYPFVEATPGRWRAEVVGLD